MSGCFDLSGFVGLNDSQKLQYQLAWSTFDRVQNSNSNVSTLRKAGNTTLPYYTFTSYNEKTTFNVGQSLHTQRYPSSNWNSVSQN
jgi:hypothetical protein